MIVGACWRSTTTQKNDMMTLTQTRGGGGGETHVKTHTHARRRTMLGMVTPNGSIAGGDNLWPTHVPQAASRHTICQQHYGREKKKNTKYFGNQKHNNV